MTTMTAQQVVTALSIRGGVMALLSLSSNPQFPKPASGSGLSSLWNTSDITTFQTTWNAAKTNGWRISAALLPSFNFTLAASRAVGANYSPAMVILCGTIFRDL